MRERERDALDSIDSVDKLIGEDLAALREQSQAPSIATTSIEESLRAALASRAHNQGVWNMITTKLKARPALSLSLCSAAVVAALLVVPLPYSHVVGHSVALRLTGPKLDGAEARRVAHTVKHALHAGHVRLERDGDGYVMRAQLSERARDTVDRELAAARDALQKENVKLDVRDVAARRERASGTVYAMARDTIYVHLPSNDLSAQQVQADIEAQLGDSDVDLRVRVAKIDGGTAVSITSDDEDVDVEIENGDENTETETHTISLTMPADATDAERIAAMSAQLKAQGVDADVTIENGQLVVTPKAPQKR